MKGAATEKTIRVVKPYCPHPPSPKQRLALELNDVQELFWGGAAGGGKSDGLIMMALQFVDVAGYSAGIFRLTDEDLNRPKSILDRARSWFSGTSARWDNSTNTFRFPSGAVIHFGYGRTKAEIETRYQGTEFQYIGIDEVGQWTEAAYRYLFSRLRRTSDTAGVPLRMRPAGNPGGIGAEWVRQRFVDHAKLVGQEAVTVKELVGMHKRGDALPDRPVFVSPPSSDVEEVARITGKPPQPAHFLPAYAEDNPGLDLMDYRVQLAKLDDATRQQLEHGDWWAAASGGIFKLEWFQYVDEVPPDCYGLLRYWDLAATEPRPKKDPDWTAGVKMGARLLQNDEMQVVIAEARRMRGHPGDVENYVLKTAKGDGRSVTVYIEEEPGSAGKNNTHNYASKVLKGYSVTGIRKTGKKTEAWKLLASDARNHMLYLVRGPWNNEFTTELCALTNDDTHAHDDMADAASGGRIQLLEDIGLQSLRAWAT